MGFTVRAELQLNKMRILLPFCSPKSAVDQPEIGFVQDLLLGWPCPQLSLEAARWGMMVGRVQDCLVELMIWGMFLLPRPLKPEMPLWGGSSHWHPPSVPMGRVWWTGNGWESFRIERSVDSGVVWAVLSSVLCIQSCSLFLLLSPVTLSCWRERAQLVDVVGKERFLSKYSLSSSSESPTVTIQPFCYFCQQFSAFLWWQGSCWSISLMPRSSQSKVFAFEPVL